MWHGHIRTQKLWRTWAHGAVYLGHVELVVVIRCIRLIQGRVVDHSRRVDVDGEIGGEAAVPRGDRVHRDDQILGVGDPALRKRHLSHLLCCDGIRGGWIVFLTLGLVFGDDILACRILGGLVGLGDFVDLGGFGGVGRLPFLGLGPGGLVSRIIISQVNDVGPRGLGASNWALLCVRGFDGPSSGRRLGVVLANIGRLTSGSSLPPSYTGHCGNSDGNGLVRLRNEELEQNGQN